MDSKDPEKETYTEGRNLDDDIDTKSAEFPTGINQRPSTPPYTRSGSKEERDLIFKQDLRIVPLSAAIYLLCYLDRSNIGNAKVLNEDEGNDVRIHPPIINRHHTDLCSSSPKPQ